MRSSAYALTTLCVDHSEVRYAARPDQETRQDQCDPQDPLSLDEQNDAHDDEDHREHPKQSWTHGDCVPLRASANSGPWTQRRAVTLERRKVQRGRDIEERSKARSSPTIEH